MLNVTATDVPLVAAGTRAQAVRVRVGATLFANIVRSGLSFASGILVARSLGPSSYGDLNFLLGSFAALGSLLEMGTSSAFYTFLAQRPRSRSFLTFYAAWMLLQFIVPVAVVLVLPEGALSWIWLQHSRRMVLLAFVASFLLTQAWGLMTTLAEARRLTVFIQSVTIAQALVHLGLIASAFYLHWLSVEVVLLFTVAEYVVCIAYLVPRLARENIDHDATPDAWLSTLAQFSRYCGPLVIYGWFSFAHVFVDRWLLQRYGGSIQQGFFSVANQFAMIGGILTASVVKVLWKEIAEARQSGDVKRVKDLYDTVCRGLFFAVAWIGCSLIPYAGEILGWTFGVAFAGATLSFALMLLYPIHQALGQAQATLFYASEDTAIYARIGLWTMALSVPVTYLMLAPRSAWLPGLALGATGLAVKMVGVNIAGVSVQTYVISRRHGWNTAFASQAAILAFLLLTGWTARGVAHALATLVTNAPPPVVTVLAGIVLYGATTLAVVYRYPALTGVDRLFRGIRMAG